MPHVPFEALPGDARVWVFAADRPLDATATETLLGEVDAFLADWHAHGDPLRCARDWRDDRFLAVGVDQSTAGASGCSVDGLFRVFKRLQSVLGASLMPSARVYWRDAAGVVQGTERAEFSRRAAAGEVNPATRVFDTAVTTAVDWRTGFERAAAESWHRTLMPGNASAGAPATVTASSSSS